MKKIILTIGILIITVLTSKVCGQVITIDYEDKETYFVYDTTIINPKKVIKDDNLQPLLVKVKGTLLIDLKNKKLTVTKMENGTPSEFEEMTFTTDIDSYVQKGNVITYYKKGTTWDGEPETVSCSVNIKKGTLEQITFTTDNYQNITTPKKIIRFELN
tara:strand:- start:142 stop:618 length:477 start_codon:yes stop_codon:yes gene_type:complete